MAEHKAIAPMQASNDRASDVATPTRGSPVLNDNLSKAEEENTDEVAEDAEDVQDDENASDSEEDPATDDGETVSDVLWVQLYHHLLLVAALQPSKPTTRLYHTAQLQYMDAYFEGRIDAEGIIGVYPAERDRESKNVFESMAEELVPGLQARIKALSEQNWKDEPANRGHIRFWP
jgi:hypothetical protein